MLNALMLWRTMAHRLSRVLDHAKAMAVADTGHVTKTHASGLKKIGVTVDAYRAMLAKQNGDCAICGKSMPAEFRNTQKNRALHLDHDHKTGNVRGILCSGCNTGLGMFKDNHALLMRASKYLRRYDKP